MRILGLGTAVPAGSVAQDEAVKISQMLMARDARQRRLIAALLRKSGVERRHSVLLPDDGERSVSAVEATQDFYRAPRDESDAGPGTKQRMEQYERHAGRLALVSAERALDNAAIDAAAITHLVVVSCTGFYAPGPEVDLIRGLGLSPEVARVNVGYMGCHGAFNGLRLAGSLVGDAPDARVLVCAVELCSLHFAYQWDPEKLVANALFADGAAAFVCAPRTTPATTASAADESAMVVGPFASRLLPDSEAAMSWRIGDHGFEMTLSSEVPKLIEAHLPSWLGGWLDASGIDRETVASWAVHPGGPRILDAVERSLGLDPSALALSRRVLAGHGNMSSATIGFILDAIREAGDTGVGVALGFGPGLMAEAFVFRAGSAGGSR